MIGNKPVTSAQIRRLVEAIQGLSYTLAITTEELFYRAEHYGFDVKREKEIDAGYDLIADRCDYDTL